MNKRSLAVTVAALLVAAASAEAQTKTLPVKTEFITATVDAIDIANRTISVTKADQTHEVLYIPAEVKRFETLKVGDKISAKYYENVVLRVKAPGEKETDTGTSGVVRADGSAAGTASRQRTITAAITAIDPTVPSITFTGPRDWKYTSRVMDPAALAKVKVGDRVDITWTEALVLSLDDAK